MTAGRTTLVVGSFASIYLFWGATFLAIRYVVEQVPPLMMMSARCGSGALILFLCSIGSGTLRRVTASDWTEAAVAGVILFVGSHGLLSIAEQRVSSGQAAIYLATIPVWMTVIELVIHRRSPQWRVTVGLCLGVIGVLILGGGSEVFAGLVLDRLALIASSLLWATGSMFLRRSGGNLPALQSSAMQLSAGSAGLAIVSLMAGESRKWSAILVTPRVGIAFAFLVVCGTVLAYLAYNWLLREMSPTLVGTYAFVNPVVAVILAWLTGDEGFRVSTLMAVLLVLLSIGVVGRPSPVTARVEARESSL